MMNIFSKIYIFAVSMIFSFSITQSVAQGTNQSTCKSTDIPKVVKPIENYDIVATNVATVEAALAFSGKNLVYSISAHPKNKKNIVSIDSKTGVVKVDAVKQDKFDITVKAKNHCGSAAWFNVNWRDGDAYIP